MIQNKISGIVIGLAIGDAFGAPYEGGIIERALWAVIGKKNGKRRWTDDTRMTVDIIESLIEKGIIDQNDLARRFADSYHWTRGYGPGAAKILKRIRNGEEWKKASVAVYNDGSFGNGGAMRAPVVGLFYSGDLNRAAEAARKTAEITHSHAEGIEGAVLVATSTALAYKDFQPKACIEQLRESAKEPVFSEKLVTVEGWINKNLNIMPSEVAGRLGNGITARDSCVTAIYIALRFSGMPYEDLFNFVRKTGGDTDTIGAMASAIWGAIHGIDAFPDRFKTGLEQYERLKFLAQSLGDKIERKGS